MNGHTPFSAIVAFLSFYTAYLIGAEHIVLSNESSANEGNLSGASVNHQYSKSFAFEHDFQQYAHKNLMPDIHYFSLLRPFNELQIAKYFAALPQYHAVFRSCNAGSKPQRVVPQLREMPVCMRHIIPIPAAGAALSNFWRKPAGKRRAAGNF